MSGALSIAKGIRTGTLHGAWNGYRNALGFKAPLVCVPAGLFMLFTNSPTLPFSLELVLTFIALGLACYSLFQNCFSRFYAAAATLVLLSTPLITGLTHRYYVELLLLLLVVVTIDLLLRLGWRTFFGSVLVGAVIGLGLLCKLTFPLFVALPLLFSFWEAIRIDIPAGSLRDRRVVALRGITAIAVAGAIAWPWYATNLQDVLAHSRLAASSNCCYYPRWLAADLSVAPSIPILLLAVVGFVVMMRRLARGSEATRQLRGWMMLLSLGLVTMFAVAGTPNKCTRFVVTWLPPFAALAIAAWLPFRGRKWFWVGPAVTVSIAITISLHNSFQILPMNRIRSGDVRIVDSRFPLNVPNWFDDDSPVDGRDYRLSEAEGKIAADAATRFNAGHTAEARTTQLGLLVNFDYFDFLSSFRNHRVHYAPWWSSHPTQGREAVDYIVYVKGFDAFYPGLQNFNYYPELESDAAAHRIPYSELFHLNGPAPWKVIVYVKDDLLSAALDNSRPAVLLEAENFRRGNVTIDNGQYGYGAGIGVIETPKPGGFAEYEFQIPVSGRYEIEIRYASGVPRPLTLSIDGTVLTTMAASGNTGGFLPKYQAWERIIVISLNRGPHTLKLETRGLFPHVDRIAFVRHIK